MERTWRYHVDYLPKNCPKKRLWLFTICDVTGSFVWGLILSPILSDWLCS